MVLDGAILDVGSREPIAIGEAPALAVQLLHIAAPDAVVIAASTRHLGRGIFDYREVGRVVLEGLADPAPAWQILGISAAASRFEALRDGGLTR